MVNGILIGWTLIGLIFSHGLDFIDLCVQVSLKHSGSLFMYAGHEGGAYAKNSFGNMYAHKRLCLSLCSPFLFSLRLMFSPPSLLWLMVMSKWQIAWNFQNYLLRIWLLLRSISECIYFIISLYLIFCCWLCFSPLSMQIYCCWCICSWADVSWGLGNQGFRNAGWI